MNSIAMPRSRLSSLSRFMICAWMLTSSALVGSSRMSSAGLVGERHGDHHPLLHAPRQLVGVPIAGPRGQAHPVQQARDRAPAPRPCPARRSAAARPTWSPTRMTGLSACIAPWKTIAMPFQRTSRRKVSSGSAGHLSLPEADPAACHPAVAGQHPHERVREAGLAAARLADDAQRLARRPRCANDTPSTARTGPPDVSYSTARSSTRSSAHDSRRSRGLTMGSMASDRSMNVTAVMTIIRPGDTTHHQ